MQTDTKVIHRLGISKTLFAL